MKLYRSAFTKIEQSSAVALGCFDGVHIGHSEIIKCTVKKAHEHSLTSVVWSFEAPPTSFFDKTPNSQSALLTPLSEKRALIKDLGADVLISVKFDEKIASLSPRKFFTDILIDRLNAKYIFCGFNYRFGHKGGGDVALLRELCEEFGITLYVIDEIKLDGVTVSSSAIRSYISNGDVEKAQKMLGRPFFLRGKVKDGQHLGRTLGFPTINQDVTENKLSIKNGVYFTKITFNGKTKYGITNIGLRPTVNGKYPVCETHILDFNGNLYGKTVTVEFLKFLRSEKKFNSLDELTAQVHTDIDLAKKYIE